MNKSHNSNLPDPDQIAPGFYQISKKYPHIRHSVSRHLRTNLCMNCGQKRTVTVNDLNCPECQERSPKINDDPAAVGSVKTRQ